jgi:hypothetical protein
MGEERGPVAADAVSAETDADDDDSALIADSESEVCSAAGVCSQDVGLGPSF